MTRILIVDDDASMRALLRTTLDADTAAKKIRRAAGTQFEPAIVSVFLGLVRELAAVA